VFSTRPGTLNLCHICGQHLTSRDTYAGVCRDLRFRNHRRFKYKLYSRPRSRTGGLSSMPSRTPAGVLAYKVRTWVCLHHEKKISRRSPEIITWESRRSSGRFCVADRTQSPPRKNYKVQNQVFVATDARTGVVWTYCLVHMKEHIKLYLLV
jgi:hypothetical protein